MPVASTLVGRSSSPVRSQLSVRDNARTWRSRAGSKRLGSAGIVNVGTGRPRALAQAIEAVAAAVGVDPVVDVVPAATDEVSDTWADPSRLRELTGLQPCTDLRDVAARIVVARRSEYVA